MEISLTGGGEVKMEFLSRELTSFIETNSGRKVGAPEFKVLEETGVFGNYYGVPREVRRAGRSNSSSSSDLRNDRGITFFPLPLSPLIITSPLSGKVKSMSLSAILSLNSLHISLTEWR